MCENELIERVEPAKKLHIAIPAYDGKLSCATTLSLCIGTSALLKCGVEWSMQILPFNPYIDDARNILTTQFLRESDATDLLFVDADVGFPAVNICAIAASTRSVVGGCPPFKADKTAFPVAFKSQEVLVEDDQTIEVSYLPTGFLRINRAVFELMPAEEYEDGEGNTFLAHWTAARRPLHGKLRHVGEDNDFCWRWQALGGKVYMIPNLTFMHVGTKTFSGNWAEWQVQQ